MSHLDEGLIHAALDGELAGSELTAMNAHLADCPACRARYQEARGFRDEATGLVLALDEEPAVMAFARAPSPMVAQAVAGTPRVTSDPAPPRRIRSRRRWWPLVVAWAATMLVAVGLGYRVGNDRGAPADLAPARSELDLSRAPAVATTNELREATGPRPIPSTAAAPTTPAATPPPVTTAPPSEKASPPAPRPAPDDALRANATPQLAAKDEALRDERSSVDSTAAGRADQRTAPAPARAALADAVRDSAPAGRAKATEAGLERVAATAQAAAPTGAEPKSLSARRAEGAAGSFRTGLVKFNAASTDQRRREVSAVAAIAALGGTIRLIDGMTPTRFEQQGDVVRVVYRTGLGDVVLEQWRTGQLLAHQLIAPSDAPADSVKVWEKRVR